MDDYISRQAAIAIIYGQHIGGKEACENARPNTYGADLREIVADIEDIPSADVRPVVRGRWKIISIYIKCLECGERFILTPQNFCPNCGADMREDKS